MDVLPFSRSAEADLRKTTLSDKKMASHMCTSAPLKSCKLGEIFNFEALQMSRRTRFLILFKSYQRNSGWAVGCGDLKSLDVGLRFNNLRGKRKC